MSLSALGMTLASLGMALTVRAGLWWPTLFEDVEQFVKQCNECQRYKAPIRRDDMPLRPMMGVRAFATLSDP